MLLCPSNIDKIPMLWYKTQEIYFLENPPVVALAINQIKPKKPSQIGIK
ncbi:hypothetical protein GvMRE_Ic1g177 [endosymbiont GvMRE of Glomus versiforme]|nr:hypothetical protein GvMRE_Ic1g177 [endosymbiont GvMRE of Glomus versiforme]